MRKHKQILKPVAKKIEPAFCFRIENRISSSRFTSPSTAIVVKL